MKIVYFGTDVFLSCFRYLAEHEEILALYTYHNDEDYLTEYEIVKDARQRGIPVVYGRIDEASVRRFFEEEGCDLFFSAEYGYLIPIPEGLTAFRGVNVHSSYLPEGRGYYPIEGAMYRGLSETGVTMHRIVAETDAGEILFRERIPITPETDSVDVYLESARRALKMTERLFSDFESCWQAAKPQECALERWAKPPAQARTINSGMTVAEAADVFRRYNRMTLVNVGGKLQRVLSLECGKSRLSAPEIEFARDQYLYGVADGHLRMAVKLVEGGV